MEQSIYNKSSYSQGNCSLEDQSFCYCVTERVFGVIDTWCVRKEHNVGPRERYSVGMKNAVPLLTSVTFAYAQNVVTVAFLTMYFRLFVFGKISHTHRPSIPLQHLLRHMGRAVSRRRSLAKRRKNRAKISSHQLTQSSPGLES